MMTDERIQYFLDTDLEEILAEKIATVSVKFVEIVEDYFKADKTGWYVEQNGQKIWDEYKVPIFWKLIRKMVMPMLANTGKYSGFTEFIFPAFESYSWRQEKDGGVYGNFWHEGEPREFNNHWLFHNAIFLGNVLFQQVNFNDSVSFKEAQFLDSTKFQGCKFHKDAIFQKAKFAGPTAFNGTDFGGDCSFAFSEFLKKTAFFKTSHSGYLGFRETMFNKVWFEALADAPQLLFLQAEFNENVIFRRMDLTNVVLEETDIGNAHFDNCIWGGQTRIILRNEHSNTAILEDINRWKGNSATLENTYRQLKRCYEIAKNWELSGKAYVSEMEMAKKRLWNNGAYYHWFIYWFYGFFGGYTQNIKKPILSLIGLLALFTMIFLFMDGSIYNALQRSALSAFPWIKTNLKGERQFYEWWTLARNIETVLSGTFLSFFILALRKRFKQ